MGNSLILEILILLQLPSASYCKCNTRKPFLLKVSDMTEISKLLPNRFKICHLKITLINISIIRYGDLPKNSETESVSIFGDKIKHIKSGTFKLFLNAIKFLE